MARYRQQSKSWFNPTACVAALLAALFLLFLGARIGHAQITWPAYTEKNVVRSILGEARGEGYLAMYAHACAIRNRKNLEGVFGSIAPMEQIPQSLREEAKKAWIRSKYGKDITNGATHWLSDYDKQHRTSWRVWLPAYKMVARVGTTSFYKRRKRV